MATRIRLNNHGRRLALVLCAATILPGSVAIALARGTWPAPSERSIVEEQAAGSQPGAPQGPSAAVNGNVVTIQWSVPSAGGLPTHYLIVAGSASGSANLGTHNVGAVTSISVPLPAGHYFARIIAANGAGQGPQSEEVSFAVAGVVLPGAPRSVGATSGGSVVTLSWLPPDTGGPVSGYMVRAGTTSGVADLFSGSVGPATVVSAALQPGTYFMSVAAQNVAGTGPYSTETSVSVANTCSPPGAPSNLRAQVTGGFLGFLWTPPAVGSPIYIVEAGTAAGLSDLGRFVHSTTPAVGFANVPPGTYFVRVRSRTACGDSSPSNEVSVTIGAALPNISGTWTLTRSGSTAYPWIQTYSTLIVTLIQNGTQLSGSIRPAFSGASSTPIFVGSVSSTGVVRFGSESAYWNDAPGRIGSDAYFTLTIDRTGRLMSGVCATSDTCTTAVATKN